MAGRSVQIEAAAGFTEKIILNVHDFLSPQWLQSKHFVATMLPIETTGKGERAYVAILHSGKAPLSHPMERIVSSSNLGFGSPLSYL